MNEYEIFTNLHEKKKLLNCFITIVKFVFVTTVKPV